MPKLILASASPRRRQLLQQIGIDPICRPSNIDESLIENENSLEYCKRLAYEKASWTWGKSDKALPVIGSDTVVVLNDETLGKPINAKDAFNMLMQLSDQTHHVLTAVAMISGAKEKVIYSDSKVVFAKVDEADAKHYVASKEPLDKAGSYAVQGYAAKWIKSISGSYSGIMGLPLYDTAKLIREFHE